MIAAPEPRPPLTPEDYLTWEAQQLEKHEYINGQTYAMSGGSVNHSHIAIRLTALLDSHLLDSHPNGNRCIPGNSDLKIKIPGTHNYTYPDGSVTCDDRDKTTPNHFTYPCLIIEVLSKSTEAYDRGGKFRLYQQNPALIDYLLVSSTRIEMDLYHREASGKWTIINYQADDIVDLASIGLQFPIAQIYRNLTLTPDSP
ncbi:Uma2 family endonuclease [Prochlorothrix hollandica]|uniref:Putative restriction endonuclease domain-containing protein n=1 Tax=Prochlorothrix hollandica PCC 9006 = CALU 1027 TaxID=317619 RepID=A0A0M2PX22_PROHO|nr:Uma2 family endonuclease [Prochlorothrix hollandica]KKI99642.1 hypothetical protein PROH_07035 [Prochlorothrix hollandica PCC 9006 = CALU 1027]